MASSAALSHQAAIDCFPKAQMHVLSSKNEVIMSCHAWLAITHRVYFRVVTDETDEGPRSLLDFRKHNYLELSRDSSGESWETVENIVTTDGTEGLGVVVPGTLHGRARRGRLNGDFKLMLIARTIEQRDEWMSQLRFRVASWQALYQHARDIMGTDEQSITTERIIRQMEGILCSYAGVKCAKESDLRTQNIEDNTSAPCGVNTVYERIEKVEWMDKFNLQLGLLTASVSTAVKKIAENVDASTVEATAQNVADYIRIIPGGVSSLFQLIVVSARVAVMITEANRGHREYPVLLAKVVDLLKCVSECVNPILQSSKDTQHRDNILKGNVFEVLVSTLDLMGKIEEQMMKGCWGKFLNWKVVKEVENELSKLKDRVISVANTGDAKDLEKKVDDLGRSVNEIGRNMKERRNEIVASSILNCLPDRPSVSPYFVGRNAELDRLKALLNECGSAAITGYGGLGKTQLMAAFADRVSNATMANLLVYIG